MRCSRACCSSARAPSCTRRTRTGPEQRGRAHRAHAANRGVHPRRLLAISGLPPLNVFVSSGSRSRWRWGRRFFEKRRAARAYPVTAAVLALAAALAAQPSLKIMASPSSENRARWRCVPRARADVGMRAAMGILASGACCSVSSRRRSIGVLDAVPQMLVGHGPPSNPDDTGLALAHAGVAARGESYSAPLVFAAIVGIIGALTFLLLHARRRDMPRLSLGLRLRKPKCAHAIHRHCLLHADPARVRPRLGTCTKTEETPTQPQMIGAIRHQVHVTERSWRVPL